MLHQGRDDAPQGEQRLVDVAGLARAPVLGAAPAVGWGWGRLSGASVFSTSVSSGTPLTYKGPSIDAAHTKRPVAPTPNPHLLMFSLPARSTRLSFPILITSSPSGVVSFMWIVTVKTLGAGSFGAGSFGEA